ncbi:MAG: DUF3048 domain-containing protein [Acidimicrobiia bacterium]
MRKTLVFLTALGLFLTACSGSDAEETTTTSSTPSTTTTTEAATTTTTAPTTTIDDRGTSPLNGLPVDDPKTLERRVLAVKIDNHPNARPQSGLNEADLVVEILVEGVTRFLSMWQQSDSDYLGPMRSGRPTDGALLSAMNEPTFSISGAQSWVQSLIRGKDVYLTGEVRPETFRVGFRSAPHNLYVDTNQLREYADDRGHPDNPLDGPIWEFGDLPAGGTELESVQISFSGNSVVWVWDETEGLWFRTVGGSESQYRNEDGTTAPLGYPVMVALNVQQYSVSPPGGGKGLPSSRTTGSGTAYVFADGEVIEGTWERETESDWFTLTDSSGNVIPVPPGKIWISLVPGSSGVTLNPAG